ncbi:MAG TPA: hypothetical protein VK464_03295 [Symbiobacteriaceae bacterium]|nr:hypothetical protein [Symbiobacteriaceae bacterium]
MSSIFHFNVFRVMVMESAASINVGELVLNLPAFTIKRNQGYGDNVGDGQIVPSTGLVYDPDLIDAPVGTAPWTMVPARGVNG